MANVIAYRAMDMSNAYIWYGQVTQASSSIISISDGFKTGNYFGSFNYWNNDLYSGTLTSYNQYYGSAIQYSVTDLSLNAVTVKDYVQSGNVVALAEYALNGSDSITGSLYDDYLMGYDGNDAIFGNSGKDILDGGLGTNTAVYSGYKSSYTVSKNGSTYSISGGIDGTDTLNNIQYLQFADGVVAIDSVLPPPAPIIQPVVSSTPITQNSTEKVSTVPSAGNDLLTGTIKNDKISGLLGDDTLIGGLGADQLQGHKGADIFKFNDINETGLTAQTRDIITDFKHGDGDKIDLSAIDANEKSTGDQAFTFISGAVFTKTNAAGQLRFDATSHTLYGSTNADNKPEFSIQLNGVSSLVAADFVL
jgi:Ca2+-binding RTX toxin-like protein